MDGKGEKMGDRTRKHKKVQPKTEKGWGIEFKEKLEVGVSTWNPQSGGPRIKLLGATDRIDEMI